MTAERQAASRWIIGIAVLGLAGAAIVYFVVFDDDGSSGGRDSEWTEGPVASRSNEPQPSASSSDGENGSSTSITGQARAPRGTEEERLAEIRQRLEERGPLVRAIIDQDAGVPVRPVVHRRGRLVQQDDPNGPPRLLDHPVRTGETSPALQLQRVRSLQTLLDTRTTTLTQERATALAAGNTERVAQIDRQLEILARQRPAVENRREDLERQVNEAEASSETNEEAGGG